MSDSHVSTGYRPLGRDNWADFDRLFGPRGAYGGCWCMWWRCSRREFEAHQGEGNKARFHALVAAGLPTGIIAYRENAPIGWCAVAPRADLISLNRSRVLKALDDRPVWSITCLFVERSQRRQGIAQGLVLAALDFVRQHGGSCVEAYPTVVGKSDAPPVSSYMGTPSLFERAGFRLVASPSAKKQIWRCELG